MRLSNTLKRILDNSLTKYRDSFVPPGAQAPVEEAEGDLFPHRRCLLVPQAFQTSVNLAVSTYHRD